MSASENSTASIVQPIIAKYDVTQHILRKFKLRAVKKFGQNFLVDPSIVNGIVKAAKIEPHDRVLEIGPGIGTLTQGLLEAGAEVIAVEIDKKLPAVLAQTLSGYSKFQLVTGDILRTNILKLMGEKPFKVVANLPYYITTPILMAIFKQKLPITLLTVMVQKEVAERMTATPGTKAYGSLSVAMQYYTQVKIALNVSARSFLPQPDVESAVVVCTCHRQPPVDVLNTDTFFRVVKGAFGQRRKTLVNALQGAGFARQALLAACDKAQIEPMRRGETLSIEEFAALASAL